MSVQTLIHVLLDEADSIDELVDFVIEQRETVKSGNYSAMQETMKHIQEAFFRVQSLESRRARMTEAVAGELGCEPVFSALAESVPEAERTLFTGAGERLGHCVFTLKSEMTILSGLIEQNERLGAMLLSEWRRLDSGFMRSGGLDFRG